MTGSEKDVLEAAASIRRITVNAYVRELIDRDIELCRADPLVVRQVQLFGE